MDLYATLILEKDGNGYIAKLATPLKLKPGHKTKIALCQISYRNDNDQFHNLIKDAFFAVAIPRYTKAINETRDDKVTINFVRGSLEPGEYTPSVLCRDLNNELTSKLPSDFKPEQCRFIFSPSSRRFEVSLDGQAEGVPPDMRTTLILYWPLSWYLGFSPSKERRSFVFVSKVLHLCIK